MSAEIAFSVLKRKLHLERLQPRLGQTGCQPLCSPLALTIARVIERGVGDAEQETVEHQVHAGRSPELTTERPVAEPIHMPAQLDHERGARERKDDSSNQVHGDAPEHAPLLERKAPRQPEDRERRERP
jgi:hypothetical protein